MEVSFSTRSNGGSLDIVRKCFDLTSQQRARARNLEARRAREAHIAERHDAALLGQLHRLNDFDWHERQERSLTLVGEKLIWIGARYAIQEHSDVFEEIFGNRW